MSQRPTTAQRGYGADHQRARKRAARQVAAGNAYCWRCLANGLPPDQAWIAPGSAWDLGHDDHNRNITRGPEHARCNRATRARQDRPTRARPAQPHPGITP